MLFWYNTHTINPGQKASSDWKTGKVIVPFFIFAHIYQSSLSKYFSMDFWSSEKEK